MTIAPLRRVVARLDAWLNPPRDPNMRVAIDLGQHLVHGQHDLRRLGDDRALARLVDAVDRISLTQALAWHEPRERHIYLTLIEQAAKATWTKLEDTVDGAGLALRLWGGCLIGAKLIAHQTRSGLNTPRLTHERFREALPLLKSDAVVARGFCAAPAFKTLRRERFDLRQLPPGSLDRVRRLSMQEYR